MRYHHTKNKGDLGVLQAALDLAKKGWVVAQPLTEHAAYDLLAERGGVVLRIQVKYRTMVDGYVPVQFVSVWADRKGNHVVPMDKSAIDVVCVYCPDADLCFYLDPLEHRRVVKLRILPTKNKQRRGVVFAANHTRLPDRFLTIGEKKPRHARQDSNLR